MATAGERARPLGRLGVAVEQLRHMGAQHPGTRARGGHDIVVAGKGVEQAAHQVLGGLAVAGVEGRLAAAGLGARHLDPAAGVLEQPDRGKAYRRSEQVDQAGDEQGDAGLVGHGAWMVGNSVRWHPYSTRMAPGNKQGAVSGGGQRAPWQTG